MKLHLVMLSVVLAVLLVGGCPVDSGGEQNPFVTLAETFGISAGDEDTDDAAGGIVPEGVFRLPLTVTFTNNHSYAGVNASFVAWVELGSIRSSEQEDALLRGGYVQLTDEVRLGTVFTLPVGTFVYNGPGVAGASPISLGAVGAPQLPPTLQVSLITPDAFLVFSQPPVSCDTVAFTFTRDGEPLTAIPVGDADAPFGGATRNGGLKTLAQVDVYECSPLRPGLFLRVGAQTSAGNEYPENGDVLFEFNEEPNDEGDFGIVTIS